MEGQENILRCGSITKAHRLPLIDCTTHSQTFVPSYHPYVVESSPHCISFTLLITHSARILQSLYILASLFILFGVIILCPHQLIFSLNGSRSGS